MTEYLYHIHLGSKDTLPSLTPRIPRAILDGEDNTIQRICLSDSIFNCLIGIGYTRLDEYLDMTYDTPSGSVITILKWNIKDLNKDKLVNYTQLDNELLVDDAYITHEYWYLNSLAIDKAEVTEIVIDYIVYDDASEYVLPKILRDKIKTETGNDRDLYDKLYYEAVDDFLNEGNNVLEIRPIINITYKLDNKSNTTYKMDINDQSLPTFIKSVRFGI